MPRMSKKKRVGSVTVENRELKTKKDEEMGNC